jgi:hypothetical protein
MGQRQAIHQNEQRRLKMTNPDFTPSVHTMKLEISRLNAELAKANERVDELEQEKINTLNHYVCTPKEFPKAIGVIIKMP